MPSQTPTAFASRFQLSTIDFQLFRANSFRFTHFRKNESANPLVSHSFKTKDLKPHRITYLQKKGRGRGASIPQCKAASPVWYSSAMVARRVVRYYDTLIMPALPHSQMLLATLRKQGNEMVRTLGALVRLE